MNSNSETNEKPSHFIHELIDADNAALKWGTWPGTNKPKVHTRFPPEPNGYLHIGHAKSICLNFGLAEQYGGKCNLRFDDTNPEKEEEEYVRSIVEDVRWLGFRWPGASDTNPREGVIFSSNYFQQMYDWAVRLIEKGKAYVCDLTADETREHRGTLTRPGKDSPFRNRSAAENLDLFARMARGEFPDGSRTLRAKIDMASPNLNLRDPVMYRILHATHHNTGDKWCVYPMYDWAHGLEDSIEGITHSICTLEFENHRPLYDWFIDAINENEPPERRIHHPQQIEFARLGLTYAVMSKRKLLELVKSNKVRGWDDPRMPTLSGLRRRGYPAEAIRNFCADIGVAKFNSTIEVVRLENAVRETLNKTAPRKMAVLRPLKLIITNYPCGGMGQTNDQGGVGQANSLSHDAAANVASGAPAGRPDTSPPSLKPQVEDPQRRNSSPVELLDAINNPEDESAGTRQVPFSGTLYIERDDFQESPPKGYFRLFPGNEVRLRYAYFVKCIGCVKDPATGEVTEVHCTYDPATRGGDSPDGRKVKGTIHWVSAAEAIDAEVRLYDHLFKTPEPEQAPSPSRGEGRGEGDSSREGDSPFHYFQNLNDSSLTILTGCKLEPSLAAAACRRDAHGTITPDRFQFERHGYFCTDPDSTPTKLVFNRTVSLKDTWAKEQKKK